MVKISLIYKDKYMKHILIILMKKNNKYKKLFKAAFNEKVNLYFKMWYNKNLISFIKKSKINGIILTGSSYRILNKNEKNATLPKEILELNIPVLGLCYGYQWIIKTLCGRNCIDTFKNNNVNYKKHSLKINEPFKMPKSYYYFNHHDYIKKVPKNWKILIRNKKQIWMSYNKEKKIMGLQFHPEATKIGKHFYKKWLKYIS